MSVSDTEITSLASSHDIISLGMLADGLRRERHALRTTFLRVADVSADLAVATAATGPGQTREPDASVGPNGPTPRTSIGEIRIVGVPASRAAAVERVRQVTSTANGIAVSAFSLADLEQLSAREGVALRGLLEELRAAGLELVAEAPFDRLSDARRSIEDVNIAGLALARLTIHQSPQIDPLPLLKGVADLQRAVAVIRTFAPLPRRTNPAVPTTGYDDVKRIALARVVVDNIPSIQVDWALYGPKLAQVALTMGADDVDAVSPDDDTSQGRRRAPLEEIRRNIRAAGQEPVERNGRFERVRVHVAVGTEHEPAR
jgi:aminodeoxyfutalosine synthase